MVNTAGSHRSLSETRCRVEMIKSRQLRVELRMPRAQAHRSLEELLGNHREELGGRRGPVGIEIGFLATLDPRAQRTKDADYGTEQSVMIVGLR